MMVRAERPSRPPARARLPATPPRAPKEGGGVDGERADRTVREAD
jgi:hypothetical protein